MGRLDKQFFLKTKIKHLQSQNYNNKIPFEINTLEKEEGKPPQKQNMP
jgi:hypothetical protein